jgi:hypothetical protein
MCVAGRYAVGCLALVLTPILFGSVAYGLPPKGVFTGTIGNSKVVVELGVAPHFNSSLAPHSSLRGEYFYRKYGLAITLAGTLESDGSWSLREITRGTQGQRFTGDSWRVRTAGNTLVGIWHRSTSARTLRIELNRIGGIGSGYWFSDAKIYDRELIRDSTSRSAPRESGYGASYVVLTDPRFAVSGVEITELANERVRLSANDALAKDFDDARTGAAECLNDALMQPPFVRQVLRIALFTRSALSLERRSFLNCGGMYPFDDFQALTLDLRDGRAVDWKRAIENRGTIAELYVIRAAAIWRKRGFAGCSDLYDPKRPGSMAKATTIKDDFAYEIVPTGLLVRVWFPHVVAGCAVDVVIPSAEAWPLLRPSYRALLP